jgi:ABC-type uncharacterized transport system ATPase component
VLDGVSLSAEGGEFIALLGSSGCGKTTLLRAICGFVTMASGAISIGGRDITRLPPDKHYERLPRRRGKGRIRGFAGLRQMLPRRICARPMS